MKEPGQNNTAEEEKAQSKMVWENELHVVAEQDKAWLTTFSYAMHRSQPTWTIICSLAFGIRYLLVQELLDDVSILAVNDILGVERVAILRRAIAEVVMAGLGLVLVTAADVFQTPVTHYVFVSLYLVTSARARHHIDVSIDLLQPFEIDYQSKELGTTRGCGTCHLEDSPWTPGIRAGRITVLQDKKVMLTSISFSMHKKPEMWNILTFLAFATRYWLSNEVEYHIQPLKKPGHNDTFEEEKAQSQMDWKNDLQVVVENDKAWLTTFSYAMHRSQATWTIICFLAFGIRYLLAQELLDDISVLAVNDVLGVERVAILRRAIAEVVMAGLGLVLVTAADVFQSRVTHYVFVSLYLVTSARARYHIDISVDLLQPFQVQVYSEGTGATSTCSDDFDVIDPSPFGQHGLAVQTLDGRCHGQNDAKLHEKKPMLTTVSFTMHRYTTAWNVVCVVAFASRYLLVTVLLDDLSALALNDFFAFAREAILRRCMAEVLISSLSMVLISMADCYYWPVQHYGFVTLYLMTSFLARHHMAISSDLNPPFQTHS
ncbi:hypothetical protein MTO96_012128 [Rhipicephalus appendiculatus]